MIRPSFAAVFLLCGTVLSAQPTPKAAADAWKAAHEQQILQEFTSLLAIPNVASDKPNIRRNAETLVQALEKRHVSARILDVSGANPVVFGEIKTPGAKHTIVFYAHYDGQPVTPEDWETKSPFTPATKMVSNEPRIYARSASDDKAAIIAQLSALDALQAANVYPRANLKFVWEGEEEAGSTNLGAVLAKYKDELGGDIWLICDGPVDQSGRQTVVFGARGVTSLAITVYGPNRGLHSGHYGNWAPNPAMMLAQLLAGMKDKSGHVLIPHFYDGITPLTSLEKQAVADAPNNGPMLQKEFALGHTDGNGKTLVELLNEPSLNIDGFAAAHVGAQHTNVIPPTATVNIDMRLVKGLDWKTQQQRVVDYIKSQDYFITSKPPDNETLISHPYVAFVQLDDGYNAVRTPMDLPIAQEVIAAVESARGPVVKLPTMGGSVPLEMIENTLGVHTITVPIANYDNNQHSSNENIRLQNLWNGIETMAALEAME